MKYVGMHVGKIEGQGMQVQEISRGIVVDETHPSAEDIPELRRDFRGTLSFFEDGQFESPTHRRRCVEHAHDLRDMLEALGEDVMSADHLSSLIGGY